MTRILILGAAGSLARVATQYLIDKSNAELTLYLRRAGRLQHLSGGRVKIIEGDVTDTPLLIKALKDIDVVYANLAGDMTSQAQSIIKAMHEANVRRLIFVSSMGIYDEVPGQSYRAVLDPYRDSADLIERSDLEYTILRPAWFTDSNRVDYEITFKGDMFKGQSVSRLSIADFILKIATTENLYSHESIGISCP